MLTTRPPVLPFGSNHFSRSWLFGAVAPRIQLNLILIIIIIIKINHTILPKGKSFTANSAISTLPSSQPSFSHLHKSIYHDVVYRLISSSAANFPLVYHFLLEHPSADNSFLASSPANFFSSSLSLPALFFLLPLYLAELHFFIFSVHFTCSILLHIHISNVSRRFCSFRVVSKSLHSITLHST